MRSPRSLLDALARVALGAAAVLLLTRDASAQRACEQDPALTGRTCSVEECLALSDAYHEEDACGSAADRNAPLSCARVQGCFNLRAMRERWLNCYTRRVISDARCWGGGNFGHQVQQANAIFQVGVCDTIIALPPPVGCGDPCP